ncbi:MAG: HEAT repeat domain-containing protein [Blastocatellia bacterium]
MFKHLSILGTSLLSLTLIFLTPALGSGAQDRSFIQVQGASLRERLDSAIEQAGRLSPRTSFWAAYKFNIRPGTAIDCVINTAEGTTYVNGASISDDSGFETKNVAVFLRYEAGVDRLTKLELYNLDRSHYFDGLPVYWVGQPGNDESLHFLDQLITGSAPDQAGKIDSEVRRRAVLAVALHDDNRIGPMLESYVSSKYPDAVREPAVFWLGHVPGELPFLERLAVNESESAPVRKKAVFGIGISKDQTALQSLERVYQTVQAPEVRKETLFGAYLNKDKASTDFLIKVAETEQDRSLRKSAIFWLGQKAGEVTLKVLSNLVDQNGGETEVKKAAVFAISRRPADEAVPLLINIARRNSDRSVRKQAMFWLGQTEDSRAVDFFKEVLSK